MQVIFIKDLKKQGKKGEIKTVKDGYAENFLIKNGYAVPVNQHNLNDLKSTKEREKKLDLENRKNAEIEKQKLEKIELEFKVKIGKEDRVFGSISVKQIKEELNNQGFKIDKKQIMLTNNIASLGYHDVSINLYADVNAKVKVHVVK